MSGGMNVHRSSLSLLPTRPRMVGQRTRRARRASPAARVDPQRADPPVAGEVPAQPLGRAARQLPVSAAAGVAARVGWAARKALADQITDVAADERGAALAGRRYVGGVVDRYRVLFGELRGPRQQRR